MFCRDKDFVLVSGSPGEIRGSTTSIPEIAVRFHVGKVRLALFIYYFFFYSDCIFFFFFCWRQRLWWDWNAAWFSSNIGLGNKWKTQETAEFESNPGVVSLGRKVPHLVRMSALTWVWVLSLWWGPMEARGLALINQWIFRNSTLCSILDAILEILWICQVFEYSPHLFFFCKFIM